MNEKSPAEFNQTFWDIVIAEAARDAKIVRITYWLTERDLKDMSFAPDYYEDMKETLIKKYGLIEELHSRVYNECENNLKEEMIHHGEA